MTISLKALACGVAAFSMALAALPVEAQRQGRYFHQHGHGSGGLSYGGIGIGIGIGLGPGWPYDGGWAPGYVGVPGPAIVDEEVRPAPAPPLAPEPIVDPRAGQSPAQLEADRRACNRWATTQPSALADASVFQRTTLACLEARGYTVR
jgi:hypothetical protein